MIKLEMKSNNMILTEKQQKYWHYHQVKLIKVLSDQSRMIEETNFTYSPLEKALEKQTKTIEAYGRKQNAILNQNERQVGLTNNDDKNLSHKEPFKEPFRKRFLKIIELTDETNFDDLIYCFKDDSSGKRFDDFENGIQRFE